MVTFNFGNFQSWQFNNLAIFNFDNSGNLGNFQFGQPSDLATFNFRFFSFDYFQFRLFSSKIFEWVPITTTTYQLYGSCDQKTFNAYWVFTSIFTSGYRTFQFTSLPRFFWPTELITLQLHVRSLGCFEASQKTLLCDKKNFD